MGWVRRVRSCGLRSRTLLTLGEHELLVLLEACRTVDTLNELEDARKAEGSVIDSPHGKKAHPAVVEARQQRLVLAKLLASLAIPAEAVE
jgi:hypothetical protein